MTGVKVPNSNFSNDNNLFYSSNYQCASTSAFLPLQASTPYYTSSASMTLSPSYFPDSVKSQQFIPFWHSNNSSFSSEEASSFMSKIETPSILIQQYSFKNTENYNDKLKEFNLANNAGKKKINNKLPNK